MPHDDPQAPATRADIERILEVMEARFQAVDARFAAADKATEDRFAAAAATTAAQLAALRDEVRAAQDRAVETIGMEISQTRQASTSRFDFIDRRLERMEVTLGALQMQAMGMGKALAEGERADIALNTTQGAQQRAIDDLARRVSRIEERLHQKQ